MEGLFWNFIKICRYLVVCLVIWVEIFLGFSFLLIYWVIVWKLLEFVNWKRDVWVKVGV